MEQHQLPHQRIGSGVGENVTRRRHIKNFGAFAIKRRFDFYAGDILDVLHQKVHRIHQAVRLDAQMITLHIAVGYRRDDPVDIATDQVQQFPADHRDLRRIDAVGAEDGATAAFGALMEIVEPFFDHVFRQFTRTGEAAQGLAGRREVIQIDGSEQLGPQHRHIARIAGSQVKMAFIGAGAAAHATIHEYAERTVALQAFPHPVQYDFLPVGRQFPVSVFRRPLARVRQIYCDQAFCLAGKQPGSGAKIDRRIHPMRLRDSFITGVFE